jgi:uncharacterized protein YeaO (DUF488 family)
MTARIEIKRVYDPPARADGYRILVERLWPRGVTKEALQLDAWIREVAPSTALRKWFGHEPAKWREFQRRYAAELEANPGPWLEILEAGKKRVVTLLFSSRDAEHNNVVALRAFLQAKVKEKPKG